METNQPASDDDKDKDDELPEITGTGGIVLPSLAKLLKQKDNDNGE